MSGTSVSDNTVDFTTSSDHPTAFIGEPHHPDIDGGGWVLVKRAKHRWFASEDKLTGTSEYGEFIDDLLNIKKNIFNFFENRFF